MKLRVFVTPQTHVIDRMAARLLPSLTGWEAGADGERTWEFAVTGADAIDPASAAENACHAWCAALPAGAGAGTVLRAELEKGETAGADAPGVCGAPAGPATFHDLDGAAVHAILPKLLAALGTSGASAAAVAQPTAVVLPGRAAGDDSQALVRAVPVPARFAGDDGFLGAQIGVADRVRVVACAGAAPLAVAARLTLPRRLSVAQLNHCAEQIRGLRESAGALGVTLAAVSLAQAEPGTPVLEICAAGVMPASRPMTSGCVSGAEQALVLLGEAPHELGGSRFVEVIHGVSVGPAPALELAAEKRLDKTLLALIRAGVVVGAHSLGAGGLLVAASQMLFAPGRDFGARLDLTPLGGARADALLFGESQGRVIIAGAMERVGTILAEAQLRGVPAVLIGETIDGPVVGLKTRSLATEWVAAELRARLAGEALPAPVLTR